MGDLGVQKQNSCLLKLVHKMHSGPRASVRLGDLGSPKVSCKDTTSCPSIYQAIMVQLMFPSAAQSLHYRDADGG